MTETMRELREASEALRSELQAWRAKCEKANARVSELELAVLDFANRADVANARADAAERKVLLQADAPALVRRVQELEDGLRASNRDGCAEIRKHELTRGRAERAESEAMALRAEVERLRQRLVLDKLDSVVLRKDTKGKQ